jgi:hypothetical protein
VLRADDGVPILPPSSHPSLRLNAIAPYYTMFPLEFPLEALARARPGEWVLDPFCGRGTTLFAARLLGQPSVGVDASPVAAAMAAAKLIAVTADEVIDTAATLLTTAAHVDPPRGEFWDWAYHAETLIDLARLRQALLTHHDEPSAVMIRALTLGILHGPLTKGVPTYLSNQMPRTYATKPAAAVRYWATRDMQPPRVQVLDAFARRARRVLAEVPPKTPGYVVDGDCRGVLRGLDRCFRWVVTSPPYLGMRTYLPDQWLRRWFLGGAPQVTYEADGQLGKWTSKRFTSELSAAWQAIAAVCLQGAVLVVRFGALPSKGGDPRALLVESIVNSDAGWQILGVAGAGEPPHQARQASQFTVAGRAVQEIDLIARVS